MRSPLLLLVLALPLQAQITYDAGVAGNPPTAPSPTAQGWTELLTGGVTAGDVSPDPAWQINDASAGVGRYSADLYTNQKNYECELVVRPLAGTLWVELDGGDLITDNIFEFELRLVGQDVHVVELGSGQTIVCPNAADGAYHSFHFLSGYSWDTGQVRYDGVYMGSVPYTNWGLAVFGEGLRWGTTDPTGRARFHKVWMDIVKPRAVGESYCGPAVQHSGGQSGRIEAFGIPYAWHNDLRLDAVDLPMHQFGYFLVSATQAFVPMPCGSQGNLCLGGNIGRYASDVASTGAAGALSLQIDLTDLPTAPPSSVVTGESWNFQTWFRDVNPAPTSNFTDAVTVHF
ncbi:MAG: hypothetical protein O2816_16820 [Planctomycetota bacterium]|nr:hypothetical protein [Planctomycetota bacterium]